ncbi:hypothetical protein BH23ACT5_BH23ACT5_02790 [soil metagenome]
MKRIWAALPGPTPLRVVLAGLLAIAALAAMVVLFEWAGDFLDSGGAIG